MSSGATILIEMRAPQWEQALGDPQALCRAAVDAALAAGGAPAGEVSIVLGDDEFIQGLNREHRGQDRATNVLAFALDTPAGSEPGPRLLGDIVLAYETTAREASAFERSLADRLSHLVVHAALHLLGYRHETGAEAKEMERLETVALAGLGVADPYTLPAAEQALAGAS